MIFVQCFYVGRQELAPVEGISMNTSIGSAAAAA